MAAPEKMFFRNTRRNHRVPRTCRCLLNVHDTNQDQSSLLWETFNKTSSKLAGQASCRMCTSRTDPLKLRELHSKEASSKERYPDRQWLPSTRQHLFLRHFTECGRIVGRRLTCAAFISEISRMATSGCGGTARSHARTRVLLTTERREQTSHFRRRKATVHTTGGTANAKRVRAPEKQGSNAPSCQWQTVISSRPQKRTMQT